MEAEVLISHNEDLCVIVLCKRELNFVSQKKKVKESSVDKNK